MVDINIEDVTNSSNTGIFDKLMSSVNKNIELQFQEGRITTTEYATVYLGSLQSVLAQSVQYTLQESLTEAQVEGILADNLLKDKQLEISALELQIKQFELDNVVPKQLEKLEEEIDLLQTQDSETLLNGALNRLLIDEQIESADKQQLLIDEQTKIAYTDRVLKDKQSAKLGLDNVIKLSEEERTSNPNYIYTPKYKE